MDWMDKIASESVLNQAYAWLCERRRDCSPTMTSGICAIDGAELAESTRSGEDKCPTLLDLRRDQHSFDSHL